MNLRTLGRLVSLGMFSCLCVISNRAEAIVASVKSTGMAATAIAYPLDSECAAFNPAGMAEVGDRFDTGFAWQHTEQGARIQDNLAGLLIPGINGRFDGAKTKDFYSGDFGVNKRLFCDLDMYVGLVVYNRNFSKTTFNSPFPLIGTSNLGLEYLHETIAPSLAVKLWDRHCFGITLNYNVQRIKVNGVQNFDNPLRSAYPGFVTNRGYSWANGVGFTLGWKSDITNWLSVGATYQPKTIMNRFRKYKGFLARRGRLDIPQKIGAGIAIRFLPNATIAFDVEHIQWSRVRALHNPIAENLIADPLGSRNGTGFGFRNQMYYRVGLDWDLNKDWTVRAGFRHVRTPIPSSQTVVNLLTLDTVQDVLTLGATRRIFGCAEISGFYAHGFRHRINGKNSIPASFGGGEANIDQKFDAIGLGFGSTF